MHEKSMTGNFNIFLCSYFEASGTYKFTLYIVTILKLKD